MDSYGVGHRKEVEKPKGKRALAAELKADALAHAIVCVDLAGHLRYAAGDHTPASRALDQAAELLRRF